jgi:hypothetical protein
VKEMRNDSDRPATATSTMSAISSLVFRSIRDIVKDARDRTAAARSRPVLSPGHRQAPRYLPTSARAKKRRFAGRSARRRTRYGYQAGPKGT